MDAMTTKMAGKIRNVTCVMQELGYVSILKNDEHARFGDTIKIDSRVEYVETDTTRR